jgi:hypothetical protein
LLKNFKFFNFFTFYYLFYESVFFLWVIWNIIIAFYSLLTYITLPLILAPCVTRIVLKVKKTVNRKCIENHFFPCIFILRWNKKFLWLWETIWPQSLYLKTTSPLVYCYVKKSSYYRGLYSVTTLLKYDEKCITFIEKRINFEWIKNFEYPKSFNAIIYSSSWGHRDSK